MRKKIIIVVALICISARTACFAWNVPFNPNAEEITASSSTADVLTLINTLINWLCAILCVIIGFKAASKLHNSDIKGFVKTITAAFLIGCAPYLSQYFMYH